jgi:mono/diheme cytochrome c family protein
MRFRLAAVALLLLAPAACAAALEFRRDGAVVRTIDATALADACGVRTIDVDDPYYETQKRYRACPLGAVFEAGFGAPPSRLEGSDVLFRALDGYVKPSSLARVGEDGGFVAFGEADRPGFARMGRRELDPGPFYVVWTKAGQANPHAYPWPYQLASIELGSVAGQFPHTAPAGIAPGEAAWRGFDIFRSDCIACHSINREGGTVGPELNLPRSIVEYRPADQLKAYIKNPAAFRYGNMPAHEHLTPADLDALVAYFRAMKERKHDPGAPR